MLVYFSHVGSGLMVGHKELTNDAESVNESLAWFEIASDDGKWIKAEAKIISKNEVEVYFSEVAIPVNVRYAWYSYPEKEGFPAAILSSEKL